MKISQNGINSLVKAHEGLRLIAYDDLNSNKKLKVGDKVAGTLTIGYGHTGKDVFIGQTISELQANALFFQDTAIAERAVMKGVKVATTANMNDALIDFAFNCGIGAFADSMLLRKLNASDYLGAADQFLAWTKAKNAQGVKVEMRGLVLRCNARRDLFLNGIGVNTYYAPDGTAMKNEGSGSLLKLVALVSAIGSV